MLCKVFSLKLEEFAPKSLRFIKFLFYFEQTC